MEAINILDITDKGENVYDLNKYQEKTLTHYTQVKEDGSKESTIQEVFKRIVPLGVRSIAVLGYSSEQQYDNYMGMFTNKEAITGGRIMANGGGTGNGMFGNCFVQGISDSREGIMQCQANTFTIYAHGGGVGTNFSPLRPKGAEVKGVKSFSSGPCSFIEAFDHYAETIKQGSSGRRAAKMTILNVDHPDIEEFITTKLKTTKWKNTNISVGITDDFMEALKTDSDWDLKFDGKVYKTIKAKYLWDLICSSAHKSAEPGLLYLDSINKQYPLRYLVALQAVNPCGELPLRNNEMCLLLSLIIASFVIDRDGDKPPTFDWERFIEVVKYSVMYLDTLIDVTKYPLPEIGETMLSGRPLGLGLTSLADALFKLELPYGDHEETIAFVDKLGEVYENTAKKTSERLAEELGAFPDYDAEKADFPPRRNSVLLAIAPTGTISGLVGCSYGMEPHFAPVITRNETLGVDTVSNKVIADYMEENNLSELPSWARFVGGVDDKYLLSVKDHLVMLKTLARHVDSAISKSINLPKTATVEQVSDAYMYCWENEIKGCTVYVDGSRKDQPVTWDNEKSDLKKNLDEIDIELVDSYRIPRKRPTEGLPATVYGLKFNPEQPTLWITITELEGEPFELFFSINNKTYQELLDFAGKSVTSSWRRAEWDIHLFEDFKSYESANGGSFYEYTHGKKIYIKSILHGISVVVLNHFRRLGLNDDDDRIGVPTPMPESIEVAPQKQLTTTKNETCPECGEPTLIRVEGCLTCTNCPYSKCG